MIHIVHADDHAVVRQGLGLLLVATGEIAIDGEAGDGEQAVALVKEHRPDVAVLDLSMPNMDGLKAATEIATACPQTRVLILSMYYDEANARRAIQAGATGFLSKSADVKEVLAAIKKVHSGKRAMPESLASLEDADLDILPALDSTPLSKREFQVMCRLADCRTSHEIAKELGVSVKTVDSHRGQVLRKLGLRSNSELTRYAIRNNLMKA